MTVFFQHLHQNLKGTIKMVCLSVCVFIPSVLRLQKQCVTISMMGHGQCPAIWPSWH